VVLTSTNVFLIRHALRISDQRKCSGSFLYKITIDISNVPCLTDNSKHRLQGKKMEGGGALVGSKK
jgi:hypothetical protein